MDPEHGQLPARPAGRPESDLAAVLIGNASLLGVGYLILRRWRLALLALAGTTVLVILLGVTAGSPLVLVALAVWGAAMVGHGWWLVRGTRSAVSPATRPWAQRVVAGGVVVVLVGLVVGLRGGTAQTVHEAADAHVAGDCERASELLAGLDPVDRAVSGPMALKGAADLEACRLLIDALALGEQDQPDLSAAAAEVARYLEHPNAVWEGAGAQRAAFLLDAAYDGGRLDQEVLETGFEQLRTTLEDHPREADRVAATAETFLTDLAKEPDDCAVRDVVEWVDGQDWTVPQLAEPVAAASGEVPRRVLRCARALADEGELTASRNTYQAFLHDFRADRRADTASDELYGVITDIQRKKVRMLLAADRYCANPQPYRGAAPYRVSGVNPMRVFGIKPTAHEFPRRWHAHDLDDMVLVACVDGPKKGSYQDTCLYESDASPFGSDVRFYASRFDVKLYEVRTGRQVAAFSDEFGKPCPESILVESYTSFFVPPDTKRSSFTSADLRGMFEPHQS